MYLSMIMTEIEAEIIMGALTTSLAQWQRQGVLTSVDEKTALNIKAAIDNRLRAEHGENVNDLIDGPVVKRYYEEDWK
jgi:ABC-type Fe3+ transport system substrate-binding protein